MTRVLRLLKADLVHRQVLFVGSSRGSLSQHEQRGANPLTHGVEDNAPVEELA